MQKTLYAVMHNGRVKSVYDTKREAIRAVSKSQTGFVALQPVLAKFVRKR